MWPYLADDPDHADELRIDLDPSPGVVFDQVREAAAELKTLLDEDGVVAGPKTTGNRGLHVYARLEPRWTSYDVRAAAVAVGRELERRRPDLITAAWWKEERGARVFIDFNQNAPHKTVFGAWSVRPRAGGQVSTPFSWDELPAVHPEELTLVVVPSRVERDGDPWDGMAAHPQSLEPLLEPFEARSRRRPHGRAVAARVPEDARRAPPREPEPQEGRPRLNRAECWCAVAPMRATATRSSEGSAAFGEHLGELAGDGDVELGVRAGLGRAVVPPADEAGDTAEPTGLQLVELDLDDALDPYRIP